MKILVGATEICGQIQLFAEGFRKLGHQVTTAVVQRNEWWPVQYDYDFTERPFDLHRILDTGFLFGNHDLFFYQWGRNTLLPNLSDLPYLKSKGKKIVSALMGSDVRHYPSYAAWYSGMAEHIHTIPYTRESINASLRPLRTAEMYADVVLSQVNQQILGVRPYHHLFIPLNVSELQYAVPDNKVPVILHIPARRGVKGTELFLAALDALKQEGVAFELRLLENIPHKEVLEHMQSADIYLDELFFPLHGKTTIEALGSGCAVVNGDNLALEPYPPERPIWCVQPWNLKEKLREIIVNREDRLSLAKKGRPFVEKYHDHFRVAEYIMNIVEAPGASDAMHWPAYYATRFEKQEDIEQDVLTLTEEVIRQYGLPQGVSINDLCSGGLLPETAKNALRDVQRWSATDSSGGEAARKQPHPITGIFL